MAKNLLQNSCDLQNVTTAAATNQVINPFGMQLLQKQTLTTAAVVPFTNLAQYPYKNYLLSFSGTVTNGSNTCMFVSTNNGASYLTGLTSAYSNGVGLDAGSTNNINQTGLSYVTFQNNFAGTGSYQKTDIWISGIGTANIFFNSLSNQVIQGSSASYYALGGGINTIGGNVNAIQIATNGNGSISWVNMTFWLYGLPS